MNNKEQKTSDTRKKYKSDKSITIYGCEYCLTSRDRLYYLKRLKHKDYELNNSI